MAFSATDLYLASGTGVIFNSWIPYVTKFDTSSFYNWEQDNLPLYDLEDRTNLLWEKLGYPIADGFSGIPGLMFAVSADAPFAGESSGMIFKSVSSVIAALPEVITLPIIIEVCNFGDLGTLELRNLKFKDNGGLEIVNRNFGKLKSVMDDGSGIYGVNVAGALSSVDLWNTVHLASCVSLSARVSSGTIATADDRFDGNNIVYTSRANGFYNRSTTSVYTNPRSTSALTTIRKSTAYDSGNAFGYADGASYIFTLGAGYENMTRDMTASASDILPYNQLSISLNPASMQRTTGSFANTTSLIGMLYGNWFSKVVIENCNGPLYIRHFAVDGGSGYLTTLQHNTVNGFEINNSKLVLENVFACRCREAGFRFSNSDITILRGIVAYRNYTLTDYQTRSAYKSAGIRAVNSNIALSASPYASGVDFIIQSTKNAYGIELFNSRWRGGQSRKDTGSTSGITWVKGFYNTESGIKLNGSYMEVPGRLDCYNNKIGLELVNSEIALNEGTFEFNNDYGIRGENSLIRYNQDLYKYTQTVSQDEPGQVHFRNNAVNLSLDRSEFKYTDGASLASKYGSFYISGSTGAIVDEQLNKTSLPNIQLNNGSTLRMLHNYIFNKQTIGNNLPIYGLNISLRNNSKATLIGTQDHANVLIGPDEYSLQPHVASIAADNASIIEIQGPTLIGNTGIGLLAENNSIINITPPRDTHGNLLLSAFDLSGSKNHTKVEIHSTRACIVVNKNSILNMQDLGSYNAVWPTATASAGDYNYQNETNSASAVSGGYMQFYPNGQDGTVIAASAGRDDVTINSFTAFPPAVPSHGYLLLDPTLPTANDDILEYSTGGMCVRVMNGSIANVKNVHFPCGWDNTSGIYYDVSGGNCDLLRIWNIGADSELDASYFSVSSLYPSLAGYYGPSAVYTSGGSAANAAPSWVPDSATLSVLDYYGASGSNTPTNYGPFRIYVSLDGPSKFLNYYDNSGLYYNIAYQTWSQGYNPSGALSAAPQVSSYYSNLTTSAFLTTSALMDPGYRSRIRLDQSAADSFANARNGAIARSGRVPFCTIYRSSIDEGGEGFDSVPGGKAKGVLSVNIFDLSRDN